MNRHMWGYLVLLSTIAMIASGAVPASRVPQLHRDALAFAADGKLQQAMRTYERIWKTVPAAQHAVRAKFCHARILEHVGELERAFALYQQVVDEGHLTGYCARATDHQYKILRQLAQPEPDDYMSPGRKTPHAVYRLMEKLLLNAPEGEQLSELSYLIGLYREQHGEQTIALAMYEKCALEGNYEWMRKADFAAARCVYARAMRGSRDQGEIRHTHRMLSRFIMDYNEHDARTEAAIHFVNDIMAQGSSLSFEVIRFYHKDLGDTIQTLGMYMDFIEDNPRAHETGQAWLAAHSIRRKLEVQARRDR